LPAATRDTGRAIKEPGVSKAEWRISSPTNRATVEESGVSKAKWRSQPLLMYPGNPRRCVRGGAQRSARKNSEQPFFCMAKRVAPRKAAGAARADGAATSNCAHKPRVPAGRSPYSVPSRGQLCSTNQPWPTRGSLRPRLAKVGMPSQPLIRKP
jgi:hypothetical protein